MLIGKESYLLKIVLAIGLSMFSSFIYAQRIDHLGKAKPVTITGGVSANSIFYEGSANRKSLTYFLNGNVNVNLYGLYNIPVSFSYTNQQFSFNEPSFKINRLSLHPSYKWVTTHIGDVAMSFSPYTLNGHQFTGFGVDLTPNGPFKVSAMYGRLVRDREYNADEPQVLPSYKRMGYGFKTTYEKSGYQLGFTLFKAKDELNSLTTIVPDDLGVAPKENLVTSVEGKVKFLERGSFSVEYASSALTNDTQAEAIGSDKLLASVFNNKLSTTYHDAFKVDLSYTVGKGSFGVGYERVDPQYQTLGAYYFNNDLENITVKLRQTVFNDKLNININTGLQRDDLEKQKQSALSRVVAAINLSLKASEKLTLSGSYSNFRSHTQIKNQFDYINEVRPFENLDTLNFTQVSQNANLNVNYNLSQKKEKRQTLNMNVSYQNTAEKQDGFLVEVVDNGSQFFNGNMSYNLALTEKNMSITGAFNSTYNTVAGIKTTTLGPTVAIAKQFFDKTLRTTFSSSYNTTATDGKQVGDFLNLRLGGSYRYKEKHNFNLNIIQLFRNSTTRSNINDLTATIGYVYTFSTKKKQRRRKVVKPDDKTVKKKKTEKKIRIKKAPVEKKGNPVKNLIKINYKDYYFDGTPIEITKLIHKLNATLDLSKVAAPTKSNITEKLIVIKGTEKGDVSEFRENVHAYLDIVDELTYFEKNITKAQKSISFEMSRSSEGIKKNYDVAKKALDKLNKQDVNYAAKKREFDQIRNTYVHHSWVMNQLHHPDKEIRKVFIDRMRPRVAQLKASGTSRAEINAQIKTALIAFYNEQAAKNSSEKDIE